MSLNALTQHPDHALRENAALRAQQGTHLHPDAANDALFVQRGTGTLGDNQGALDVQPGTGLVDGSEHTISSITPVDIATGDGSPRRDVVYLDDTGTLTVAKGTPAAFAWDSHLSESERTIANAYRPAPPDMSSTAGLPLATITVPANATTLPSAAITELRAEAPAVGDIETGVVDDKAIQSSLDGRVVAVAPGLGVVDAIDPAATGTPVQEAVDAVNAVGDVRYSRTAGAGSVLFPPGEITEGSRVEEWGAIKFLGHGMFSSGIRFTNSSGHGFFAGSTNADRADGAYLDGFEIHGGPLADRTAGSAIYFSSQESSYNVGIGRIAVGGWGPDPAIYADGHGPYSSTWRTIFAGSEKIDGPLIRFRNSLALGMEIGNIYCGMSDPDTYAVEIDNCEFGGRIGAINCGGSTGRVLRVDEAGGTAGRSAGLQVGWVNSEPNPSLSTDHAVYLADTGNTSINHVTTVADLTVDNVVELGASQNSSRGPANKRIGTIFPKGDVNNAPIAVTAAPESPSWYWGPPGDIDYGGFSAAGVIPLADAGYRSTATKATLSAGYSLASGTYATIPFDTATYGGANFDTTNNHYTAPVDGVFTTKANVRFESGDNASRFSVRLIKNAGTANEEQVTPATMTAGANGTYTSPPFAQDVQLAQGDTLTIRAYQDTGAAVEVFRATTFTVRKVSETP